MNILTKATVLVLNRNWQAINVRTPQEAFCMMATNVATGLEIEGEEHIRPVTWEEWITLPIREQDEAVHTVRGQIRVPTVIVAVNYAKVPKKRAKLCARANRACIHEHIAEHLGAQVLLGLENHYNFAWKERHVIDGAEREVSAHRKGATPAGADVLGNYPRLDG